MTDSAPSATSPLPARPRLPDGLVVVVKEECETCQTVAPVLQQLADSIGLTVFTQDNPDFPAAVEHTHDADLSVSWHHEIETVPTLMRVVDGVETERTIGWLRDEWIRFTGVADLGPDLPPMRPGCGSMSVDPDLVDALRVRFGGSVLAARRVEVASAEDEMEMMFNRGVDRRPARCPTNGGAGGPNA